MRSPAKILLQTTIARDHDEWHIARFALLRRHLSRLRNERGERLFSIVARNRSGRCGPDPVLSGLDRSDFDALWLFGVDVGDGLERSDCEGIARFWRRGGGMLLTRDNVELARSLYSLGGVGLAHCQPEQTDGAGLRCECVDDGVEVTAATPLHECADTGAFREILPLAPVHSILRDPSAIGGVLRYLPASPDESRIDAPCGTGARVIAQARSNADGILFAVAVAFDPVPGVSGPAIVHSSSRHFADCSWDPYAARPSFADGSPFGGTSRSRQHGRSMRCYSANLALWLTGRLDRDAH